MTKPADAGQSPPPPVPLAEWLEPRTLLSAAYALSTLAQFGINATGDQPHGSLVADSSGNLYGTTERGGANGRGTVFEIVKGSGTVTVLASFSASLNTWHFSGVAVDAGGNLYGTSQYAGDTGYGSVFEVAKGSGTVTTLASFDGTNGPPSSGVVVDSNGNLYGTTAGSVFELAKGSGTVTALAPFNLDGGPPSGGVMLDGSGNLYGTTPPGGTDYQGNPLWGEVFEVVKGSGFVTPLYKASSYSPAPHGGVVVDSSGNLYGTTDYGVVEITKGRGITTLASFDGADGRYPVGGVVLDGRGNLYGTTASVGGGDQSVFEVAKGSGAVTTLASIKGASGAAVSGVIVDTGGNLYGANPGGAASNGGSVFEIAKGSGAVTTLASFNGSNGANPAAGVVLDPGGNLYGNTQGLGAGDDGTIFEIAKGSSALTTLASFHGADGAYPAGGIVLDASGNLYGTTQQGGANNDGTVFELMKGSMAVTTLASFNGMNGKNPLSGVVFDASGNLYGATVDGGASGVGTVFEIVKGSAAVTTIVSFGGTNSGANPYGGVAIDPSGNIYGTTFGSGGYGTVFEIVNGTSVVTTLVTFNGADGAQPYGGVVLDASGNLYGTVSNWTGDFHRTVFELRKGSHTPVLFNDPDGGGSYGGVVFDASGNVYGTSGGVFEIVKGSGTVITLVSFNGANGAQPYDGVVLDASGNLYGTTLLGGPADAGTVFELSPLVAPPTILGNVGVSESSSAVADQAQRSEVRNLTVSFSEPVVPGSDPFSLQRINRSGSDSTSRDATVALGTPVAVAGSNGTQWAVPILGNTAFSDSTGSLDDGNYQFVIHGAAVVSDGTPMALDFTFAFHRLLGDLSGDGKVDFDDLLALAQTYGQQPATAAQGDLNGDGTVGFDDLLALAQNYGSTALTGAGPTALTGAGSTALAGPSPSPLDNLLGRKRSPSLRLGVSHN